jgi:nitrate reductase beta subunit
MIFSQKKKICETCGKEFMCFNNVFKKRRFCSRKCWNKRELKGCYWLGKNGYLYYQKGRKNKLLVHRIIIDVVDGQVVHHKDGNKLNNNLNNLEILPNQSSHIKLHNPVLARWKKKHGK